MKKLIFSYLSLDKHILLLIKAQFFIHLVGAAFFLILNIYLAKQGFSDPEIANFISYRFLAVMALALPLGFYIRKKKLKPFFIFGSLGVPLVAISLVLLIEYGFYSYLTTCFVLWGVVFTLFQVCSLPYIMRNTEVQQQSHAISLSYATHSFGSILSGLIIFVFGKFAVNMDEGLVLSLISIFGFFGFYYVLKIPKDKISDADVKFKFQSYNWKLLLNAIIPTLIIAIGAGLTIPFINLFFYHNFQLDSSNFALIGGVSSVFVAVMALLVPPLKNKLGFRKGITYTQSSAVLALVILATMEFYSDFFWALPIAVIFYWLRAPLMNMAAPMTSELTMNYVGEKNQEMLSAIMAAIWSGSWFFSSQIFRWLKSIELSYAYIFYMTAVLYAFGILMYYLLILDYEKK